MLNIKKLSYYRRCLSLVLVAIIVSSLASCVHYKGTRVVAGFVTAEYANEHSSEVFLVMYDAKKGKEHVLKAVHDYGCELIYDFNIIKGMAIKKNKDMSLEETMKLFKKVDGVISVDYDYVLHIDDPVRLETR